MKAFIGCEYSARVRTAFVVRGHYALSCDLLPTAIPGEHHQGDLFDFLDKVPDGYFDIGIFHPPCTHLAVSGARWFPAKRADGSQQAALDFVARCFSCRGKFRIGMALENPVSIISSHFCKPDQVIQPWQFGHGEVKATCLWLDGLPLLVPTNIVDGREARVHKLPPSSDRWKLRSTTYQGIADAMAQQWGSL